MDVVKVKVMKSKVCLLVCSWLLFACSPQKVEVDKAAIKRAIKGQILAQNDAYTAQNLNGMLSLLHSEETYAMGSDLRSFVTDPAEWKATFQKDFLMFDEGSISDPINFKVFISDDGSLVSSLHEAIMTMRKGEHTSIIKMRFAFTWKKELDQWKPVGMLFSIPHRGEDDKEKEKEQDSAE